MRIRCSARSGILLTLTCNGSRQHTRKLSAIRKPRGCGGCSKRAKSKDFATPEVASLRGYRLTKLRRAPSGVAEEEPRCDIQYSGETGDLKIDVRTSLPCQSTSRGIPTLTDKSFRADISHRIPNFHCRRHSYFLFEFSGGRDRIESLPGLTESGSMRQLMLPQEFFDSAGDFFPMRFERKMARIQ